MVWKKSLSWLKLLQNGPFTTNINSNPCPWSRRFCPLVTFPTPCQCLPCSTDAGQLPSSNSKAYQTLPCLRSFALVVTSAWNVLLPSTQSFLGWPLILHLGLSLNISTAEASPGLSISNHYLAIFPYHPKIFLSSPYCYLMYFLPLKLVCSFTMRHTY